MTQPRHDPLPATVTENATGEQATLTYTGAEGDAPGPVPQVPGYEILGVLGRGGMGVVYKARQLALNRTVALKMIRAGAFAGEQERARFKAEAEAAARLQHPGIVQVFEVGEHQGNLFCALEYVAGGSLAQRLRGRPFAAREAAHLVEALGRAVHLAHARNVVHRDLKPANILLAEDGTPKVADFGLARLLDNDSGRTQAGAIVGTPSYMAPEQASGRAHEAGPAADVYALGAILYECLTGRPPFKGATILETLEQVRTREPAAPRLMNRAVPRDLETVALKCLAKEPENRYASTAELADDLDRFLRGEPVRARPVGSLERAWKWTRRNPALATAVTACVLLLVSGVVISTSLALWALNEKASVEGALAQNWLSPLAEKPDPLVDQEVNALTQVAAQRGTALAARFVREGLANPGLTARLANRAPYAWQAALGLDRQRRAEAERLLLAEWPAADPARRIDLAMAMTGLGGLSPETAGVAAEALLLGIRQTTDPSTARRLAALLAEVAGRLAPAEAAAVCRPALAFFTRRLSTTTDPNAVQELARGLAAVTAGLAPAEAATILIQTSGKRSNWTAAPILTSQLRVVVRQLGPADAGNVAKALIETLNAEPRPDVRNNLAEVLGVVVSNMEPDEAVEILIPFLSTPASGSFLLVEQLAKKMEQLAPARAAAFRGKAAATFARALVKTPDSNSARGLVWGLKGMAAQMEPADAAPIATALTQALIATTTADRDVLENLADGLNMVVARLESAHAAVVVGDLARAMTAPANPVAMPFLAKALAAAADRLEPTRGAAACRAAASPLLQILSTAPAPDTVGNVAWGLREVALRLESADAAPIAAALTRAMIASTDRGALQDLGYVLAAVAGRLDSTAAAALAATLVQAISKPAQTVALAGMGMGLNALVARMEPAEAVLLLEQALGKLSTAPGSQELVRALVTVAGRLNPPETVAVLNRALSKITQPELLLFMARKLATAADLLEPAAAAAACRPVAAALIQAISKPRNRGPALSLAEGLGLMACRLEAEQAFASLSQASDKTTGEVRAAILAEGVKAAVDRLGPARAAPTCRLVIAALNKASSKPTDNTTLSILAQGLEATVGRLDPPEAAAAAAALINALRATSNSGMVYHVARGLETAATRMGPTEATATAAAINQALKTITTAPALPCLARGLAEVAARLEPTEAAAVCRPAIAALIRALSATTDPSAAQDLGVGLAAILARQSAVASSQRCAAAVVPLRAADAPWTLLTAPCLMRQALLPPPRSLPVEVFVELLEHPLCVGDARKVVLNQLGRYYNRSFVDQWDFAVFAEDRNLGLNLVAPPAR